MTDRPWPAALVYPAPLYATILALVAVGDAGPSLVVGFLLAAGFGAAVGFGILRHELWIVLGSSLLALAALLPLDLAGSSSAWTAFAVGVIVATPLAAIGIVWMARVPVAIRVVGLEVVLALGLWWIAALPVLAGLSGIPGVNFLDALGTVAQAQSAGLGALLTGSAATAMPLASTVDPIYLGLGALAIAGLVWTWIPPRTARGEPLPWSWADPRIAPPLPPPGEVDGMALRPGQREALGSRTASTPPSTSLTPGFLSVIAAAIAAGVFVAIAVIVPQAALLVASAAAVVAIGWLVVLLGRRLTPQGGREG